VEDKNRKKVTITEAAEYLGLTPTTVQDMVQRGVLRADKFAGAPTSLARRWSASTARLPRKRRTKALRPAGREISGGATMTVPGGTGTPCKAHL